MAQTVERLRQSHFRAFALKYDPAEHPFFRVAALESLNRLYSVRVGKELVWAISTARPKVRGDFPDGVNVMLAPAELRLTQGGYMTMGDQLIRDPMRHGAAPGRYPMAFTAGGSECVTPSIHAERDPREGCVCTVRFNNAQPAAGASSTAPYIVLAHELIHALHALQGRSKIGAGNAEEEWTTGIGDFAAEPITENVFRQQFRLPLRTSYP